MPPTSSAEQNIKRFDYFFCVTSNCLRCATRQCDEQNIKLRDYYFCVTSNCLRCATHQCDEQNIKLRDYFFSHYIKLFEVCHPPVLMNKILSCVIINFTLHQTVRGVPPTSSDEQNIKLNDYFFCVTSNCLRCATHQCDEQTIKLRDYFFSHYIKLSVVCHPPVLMNKILSCMIIFFELHQTV